AQFILSMNTGACNAFDQTSKGQSRMRLQILQAWGDLYFQRNDWNSAEKCYQREIFEGQRAPAETLALAKAFSSAGNIALQRGDLAKAEGHFNRALRIREKLAGDSFLAAQSLQQLGLLSRERNNLDAAERYHTHAL